MEGAINLLWCGDLLSIALSGVTLPLVLSTALKLARMDREGEFRYITRGGEDHGDDFS